MVDKHILHMQKVFGCRFLLSFQTASLVQHGPMV